MTNDPVDPPPPPVPASIERVWGLRGQPAKGPRPGLSLDRIVAAATAVAERDGLDAVSMGAVARELGSSTMALYRHVAAKSELLALMFDAGIGLPPGLDPALDWRGGLDRWGRAIFACYVRKPWLVRIPISGPPITPNQIGWLEQALQYLRATGLSEQEKLSTVLLVSGYVRNQASLTADFAEAIRAGQDPADLALSYGRTLARLIDPARLPAVHAAVVSGSLDDEDPDGDATMSSELDFGLERILDGIAVLVRGRTASGPGGAAGRCR